MFFQCYKKFELFFEYRWCASGARSINFERFATDEHIHANEWSVFGLRFVDTPNKFECERDHEFVQGVKLGKKPRQTIVQEKGESIK